MKKLIYLSLIPSLFACGGKTETTTETSETAESAPTETVAEGTLSREHMVALEGLYFQLSQQGSDGYYSKDLPLHYSEPCDYRLFDYRIYEETEYSDEWRMEDSIETQSIVSTEEKDGNIYVNTDDDRTFIFSKTDNTLVWEFAELGMKGSAAVVNEKGLGKFESKACSDTDAILASMPTSWYYLTLDNGIGYIYIPCEEATDVITFEDGYYTDSSGSDSYRIVSMTKENNVITMEYETPDGEISSTLTMTWEGESLTIGDRNYVSEQAKEIYEEIEEEC